MGKKIQTSVTIIGAGVTGLMLAKKLSALGIDVILIEAGDKLANGASTRNEGWLHKGTYHATSIADRPTAIRVARRCIYGHEWVKHYCPEAIEDALTPSYALIRDASRAEEMVSRWDEAGVSYKQISIDGLIRIAPNVIPDPIYAVFEVKDTAMNPRLLYKRMLFECMANGTQIYPCSQITFKNEHTAYIHTRDDQSIQLHSDFYIYTAGYGIRDIFNTQFGIDIPMRYWKSHMLIVDRLAKVGVFYLDPHEAAMMNHDGYSVIGVNEDVIPCTELSFTPTPDKIAETLSALNRLFQFNPNTKYTPLACTKVDMAEKSDLARSLDISITKPFDNHWCVLPGKMTEAPHVADIVTRHLYGCIGDDHIALRPMDMLGEAGD